MLTETQRDVLEKLAAGNPILVLTGGEPKAFFLHSSATVRLNTIHALERRGLVKQTAKNVNAIVELTQAGERFLMATALRRKRRRVPSQDQKAPR